ncbi:hypothetical protein RND71_035196 [Anisodus tanguticus]|uniref:Uncharacterized protein n=1 Tax=Anisodus tanguticus TaxID=243964 RepID=A0AAE1R436_9SOLA|nr:hypothetical protein RND71_035196 [Anisodus tanguticus]
MDETGVHSLLNAKKPIVSGIDTTSPVQTVAGKDSSNPLTAVTLPKSENEEATSSKTRRKLPQTLTGSTSRARSKQTKKKQQKNIEQIVKDTLEQIFREQITKETPVPSINPGQSSGRSNIFQVPEDHVSDTGSDENYDPNNAYDSGMSFDSIALHNLDT